jgi:pilus assembly protein CpaD
MTMFNRINKPMAAAIALSLGISLAGCSGSDSAERGLVSVNQPVVERTSYMLDLQTGSGGLSLAEQRKLVEWFEVMDLRYGDRIAIDDPLGSNATRSAVAEVASRHGLLLSDGAPVTEGYVDPGTARVVVTRATAYVPNCPNWSDRTAQNYDNSSWSGYGCAVNGNLAAMIADPEHLLRGATGTGETVVMSSTKAISSYRKNAPSGESGLKENATGGN